MIRHLITIVPLVFIIQHQNSKKGYTELPDHINFDNGARELIINKLKMKRDVSYEV